MCTAYQYASNNREIHLDNMLQKTCDANYCTSYGEQIITFELLYWVDYFPLPFPFCFVSLFNFLFSFYKQIFLSGVSLGKPK